MEFPLLSLPCELRLQIYENALICKGTSFRIRPVKPRGAGDSPHNAKFRSQVSPALLLSCRQVYAEAIEILYTENRFLAASAAGLMQFLVKIGRNAKFLRWIKLRLAETYRMNEDWTETFAKLAKRATRLERLEIAYVEDMEDLEAAFMRDGPGNCAMTARIMGDSVMGMGALRTLVISGFYGKDWPAYFAIKTNAVVEAYAGMRIRKPGPGTDMEKYRAKVELAKRQFEAYQEYTDNLLAEDIAREGPMLPGWMFGLTISDPTDES